MGNISAPMPEMRSRVPMPKLDLAPQSDETGFEVSVPMTVKFSVRNAGEQRLLMRMIAESDVSVIPARISSMGRFRGFENARVELSSL
jgi:hypothetical protein